MVVGTADSVSRPVAVGGTNPTDFAGLTQDCTGVTLAPGLSCTASIAFGPTAPGARSAALTIQDDAPRSPHQIPCRAREPRLETAHACNPHVRRRRRPSRGCAGLRRQAAPRPPHPPHRPLPLPPRPVAVRVDVAGRWPRT